MDIKFGTKKLSQFDLMYVIERFFAEILRGVSMFINEQEVNYATQSDPSSDPNG